VNPGLPSLYHFLFLFLHLLPKFDFNEGSPTQLWCRHNKRVFPSTFKLRILLNIFLDLFDVSTNQFLHPPPKPPPPFSAPTPPHHRYSVMTPTPHQPSNHLTRGPAWRPMFFFCFFGFPVPFYNLCGLSFCVHAVVLWGCTFCMVPPRIVGCRDVCNRPPFLGLLQDSVCLARKLNVGSWLRFPPVVVVFLSPGPFP